MQSRKSFKIPFAIIVIISIIVLLKLGMNVAGSLDINDPFRLATSTPTISSDFSYASTTNRSTSVVRFPKGPITLMIASSSEHMTRGLSGVPTLPANSGMLFTFPEEGSYGIWMKDMNFPIDIIWIDRDKVVVDINKSISPETYPNVYYPSQEISYVIELNSGAADMLDIAVGSKLVF